MNAAISLMLGVILAMVLVFTYWLRAPHQINAQWNTLDRDLQQVDFAGEPIAR